MSRKLPLFKFNTQKKEWENFQGWDPKLAPQIQKNSLKILTLNVWFENFAIEQRIKAQIEYFKRESPDIICLQEVIGYSLAGYSADPYLQENYYFTDINVQGVATNYTCPSYGVVILSKLPFHNVDFIQLPTRMDRFYLNGDLLLNGELVGVGTIHLESLDEREKRKAQLEIIHSHLRSYPHKMFMGDFNFDDKHNWSKGDKREVENVWMAQHFNNYVDIWSHVKGDDEIGFTFDTQRNPMLAQFNKTEFMRYDRIMLSSNGQLGKWIADSIEIIGNEPAGKIPSNSGSLLYTLSDHFGLLTQLSYRPSNV